MTLRSVVARPPDREPSTRWFSDRDAEWRSYLEFLLAGAGRELEGGAELEVSDRAGEVFMNHPARMVCCLAVRVMAIHRSLL